MGLSTSSNHWAMGTWVVSPERVLPSHQKDSFTFSCRYLPCLPPLQLCSAVSSGIHPTLSSRAGPDWFELTSAHVRQPLWLVEGWAPDPVHVSEIGAEDSGADKDLALHQTCQKSSSVSLWATVM